MGLSVNFMRSRILNENHLHSPTTSARICQDIYLNIFLDIFAAACYNFGARIVPAFKAFCYAEQRSTNT
jgi:hypothetical protein